PRPRGPDDRQRPDAVGRLRQPAQGRRTQRSADRRMPDQPQSHSGQAQGGVVKLLARIVVGWVERSETHRWVPPRVRLNPSYEPALIPTPKELFMPRITHAAVVAIFGFAGAALAQAPALPDLPAALKPGELKSYLAVPAKGAQVYLCKKNDAGAYAWTFKA